LAVKLTGAAIGYFVKGGKERRILDAIAKAIKISVKLAEQTIKKRGQKTGRVD
jgi:proteasome assembly chaperone (PAC2) family protein